MDAIISFLLSIGLIAIAGLLEIENESAISFDKAQSYQKCSDIEFDFIVVGAGSGGAVVANRLSQNYNVLLLEAGGTPSSISDIPYFMPNLIGSHMDYQYRTVPQKNYLGSPDKRIYFPRGKALGGSSSINSMNYLRGNKYDFNDWANETGDEEWSYDKLLPYFKKSEDYNGKNYLESGQAHGFGGELYVGDVDYDPPVRQILVEAFKEKGYIEEDLNSNQHFTTFMKPVVTTKRGRRWGTYQAFLQPIENRTSLNIYRYSKAVKINFDESNRAVGVTYVRHGVEYLVKPSKEIIVSCGVIDSPKLLMLSGIGPKEHLETVGIKSVVDLPVGAQLQDHPATGVTILFNSSISFLQDRDLTQDVYAEYKMYGTGPLSSILQLAFAFTTSNITANSQSLSPDLYFLLVNQGVNNSTIEGTSGKYLSDYKGMDAQRVSIALAKPKSQGMVTLNSSDPSDPPLIDPNYLDDETDLSRLIDAIKFIVHFYESSQLLKEIGARLPPNHYPGCEDFQFRSDDYWTCYVKNTLRNYAHAIGTCRMGRAEDMNSVVDSRLRVRKVSGLRIVDASIMPSHINGNTNAACIMIGEKGSSLILEDWENGTKHSRCSSILGQRTYTDIIVSLFILKLIHFLNEKKKRIMPGTNIELYGTK